MIATGFTGLDRQGIVPTKELHAPKPSLLLKQKADRGRPTEIRFFTWLV
jgi:hypothetical protein